MSFEAALPGDGQNAILDLLMAGEVERTFIRQAQRQALDRGLVTRQQIRATPMSGSTRKIVADVLRQVAQWFHQGKTPPQGFSASSRPSGPQPQKNEVGAI